MDGDSYPDTTNTGYADLCGRSASAGVRLSL